MGKRILSTLALWAIVLGAASLGPQASAWVLAAFSAATQFEFYTLLEKMGRRPFKRFGTALGTVMMVLPYYANRLAESHDESIQAGIIAVTIVACCLRILAERQNAERIETLQATLLGLIYIPFMFSFLTRSMLIPENESQGIWLVVWLIAAAKFTDVGALLFGKAFGRRLLSPETSPKKTWEGAIGGCLLSVALGYALVALARDLFPPFFTPLWAALFALPVAIISIVSDLIESLFKRQAAIKDSGTFIPGIGGAFDLVDSLILSAPVGFLLFTLLA